MASFNRVILLGNVTRDPELRYIASGTAVTDIGLAVNDRRKNANGEWIEETTFVDVTLWGADCRSRQRIPDQRLAGADRRPAEARYLGGNDGQKRSKLKVIGERMQIARQPRRAGGGGAGGGGRPRWRRSASAPARPTSADS